MQTAAESRDYQYSEDLLRTFADQGKSECFAACLLICYDTLSTDVVFEVAWKRKLNDYAMPYFVQVMKDQNIRMQEWYEREPREMEPGNCQ